MRAKDNEGMCLEVFSNTSIVWKPQGRREEGAGERDWESHQHCGSAAADRSLADCTQLACCSVIFF